MKTPRPYQLDAYRECIKAIAAGERPYLSMSTGSGKSLVCAMLAEKALAQGVRALVLVPTHELVLQNYIEHSDYTSNKSALGICSAKLQKFQVHKQIIYATYTSFLRRRTTSGAFNLLVLDECHYLNPSPETSYQKIIKALLRLNPAMKICGMTATPYRQDQGLLHHDCIGGKAIFTNMAYETNITDLIKNGYLSHVESISGDAEANMGNVKIKPGGDFDENQMGLRFDEIVTDAVADMRIKFNAHDIQTAIIYASTLTNARRIIDEWGDDKTIRLAYGDMPTSDRHRLTEWLKNGAGLRVVVNVGLFVTGFDYRQLDCVTLMVATMSLVKYVQICGRVIRAHDEKTCGYVLDYGGNIDRHGPIDATLPPKTKIKKGDAPKKQCLVTECGEINLASAKKCKKCGAEFVSDSDGKYKMRTKAEILAAKTARDETTHDICNVVFVRAYSRKSGLPMIKGLMYAMDYNDIPELVYEHYLCLDHAGFAGDNARRFLLGMFKNPSDFYALGKTHINVANILLLLNNNGDFFKKIKSITIDSGCRYKTLKKVFYNE